MTLPGTEVELRRALDDGALELVYQPVVNLHDATIGGVEALLRWRRPDGLRSAGTFLPDVHDPELLDAVTRFVFDTAAEQAATWRRRFESWWFPVSVNLAASDFTAELVEQVVSVRERHELPIGAIALDISEPVLLADPETSRRRCRALKQAGAQIVIDDFGVTHATAVVDHEAVDATEALMLSLVALDGFSIDVVKVDRALLDVCFADEGDTAVIQAIVKRAHLMGFRALAEGVETGDEAEWLREVGFDLGQGYYFQRPHGPGHIDRLLHDLADARAAFSSSH